MGEKIALILFVLLLTRWLNDGPDGPLGDSTLAEWKNATLADKTQACTTWLMSAPPWKAYLESGVDDGEFGLTLFKLMNAVDDVAQDDSMGFMKSKEIAAEIISDATEYGPGAPDIRRALERLKAETRGLTPYLPEPINIQDFMREQKRREFSEAPRQITERPVECVSIRPTGVTLRLILCATMRR